MRRHADALRPGPQGRHPPQMAGRPRREGHRRHAGETHPGGGRRRHQVGLLSGCAWLYSRALPWSTFTFKRKRPVQPWMWAESLAAVAARPEQLGYWGAYRVMPGTRSKSGSALARLVKPWARMTAITSASLCKRPVCWLIPAAGSNHVGSIVRIRIPKSAISCTA